ADDADDSLERDRSCRTKLDERPCPAHDGGRAVRRPRSQARERRRARARAPRARGREPSLGKDAGLLLMAARAPDIRAGQVLPGTKYTVVRELGAGGMGVVYQVVKPPEIQGVLKLMSMELAEHEEFRQKFYD